MFGCDIRFGIYRILYIIILCAIWKLINERHGDWEEDGAGEGGWGSGKGGHWL